MNIRRVKPYFFILAGVIAMAGYEISLRVFHSALFESDFIHGAWLGVGIGFEIIGLMLLVTAKSERRF